MGILSNNMLTTIIAGEIWIFCQNEAGDFMRLTCHVLFSLLNNKSSFRMLSATIWTGDLKFKYRIFSFVAFFKYKYDSEHQINIYLNLQSITTIINKIHVSLHALYQCGSHTFL